MPSLCRLLIIYLVPRTTILPYSTYKQRYDNDLRFSIQTLFGVNLMQQRGSYGWYIGWARVKYWWAQYYWPFFFFWTQAHSAHSSTITYDVMQ